MIELKIRTHGNENLSKAIQDELFKLGAIWCGGAGRNYDCLDAHHLYINYASGGGGQPRISKTEEGAHEFFNDDENEEVTIYDLIKMNAKKDIKDSTLRKIRKELEEHNKELALHNKVGVEIAKRLKEEEGK